MRADLKRLHDWLLIGGNILRARPGHGFQIVEVQKPMTEAELREVGKPGWGKKH